MIGPRSIHLTIWNCKNLEALLKTDGKRTKKKFYKTSKNTGILEMKLPASMEFVQEQQADCTKIHEKPNLDLKNVSLITIRNC